MNFHFANAQNSRWTDSAVALLRKLYVDGLSASQIARELGPGFTRNAVIGKIHRLGLNVDQYLTEQEKADRAARLQTARGIRQERQNERRRLAREANPRMPRPPKPTRSQTLREMFGIPTTDCLHANSKNIPFIDLEPHHCRFGYGTGPYLFCGNDKTEGSSYCAGHHVLCWTPARVRTPTYVGRR